VNVLKRLSIVSMLGLLPALASAADERLYTEAYRNVPMPAGFRVEATPEGPVFANTNGMTLYKWPQHKLRNGYSGESPSNPACYDDVLTVTAGLMSPYPPGIKLPELDKRKGCTDLWHPVFAAADAEEVGEWTIVERRDGALQWAYEEQPLYTSIKDSQPGDAVGGTRRSFGGDSPAKRVPVGPPSLHPPGFSIRSTFNGRMLATDRSASVYSFDGDTATSTACEGACLTNWEPVVAPSLAREQGEWSLFERSPGVRQWVFRGKPLYTYALDAGTWSQTGTDIPGWNNVYTQLAEPYPASFKSQPTMVGNALATAEGKSIYVYNCGEDSQDQLGCDHPDDTQVYRLAMCGAGDPERCQEHWPYVIAGADEESTGRIWRIVWIDPMTGRFAEPNQEGALRVWAYRDRPVYTFGGDTRPGDLHGGGTGEWRGQRNGLKAIMLRDDFFRGHL